MFNKILVVCMGNICRSPFGERYLQTLFPDKTIASAGIVTKKSGLQDKSADETAIQVAKKYGIDLLSHHAQQVTSELCHHYDLILVMEEQHIRSLCAIAPEARGKIMLFAHWQSTKNIPDPFRKSEELFELSFKLIEESAKSWIGKF